MTENKRYELAYEKGNWWAVRNGELTLWKEEVVDRLNEQEETIQTQKEYIIRMGHGTIFEEMKRLKERNQRQYERLKEITDLMSKRDWETLEKIVEDWEQTEELLQAEFGNYGGVDD